MAGCNQPFIPSGPTRVDSLTPNGTRPPKRPDILDMNDCCSGGGGGGGGNAIIIQNQGVTITSQASTINFEGTGVEAEITAPGVVTVFVPPPAFVSHFNSADGIDNAVVTPATTAPRFVSAPTSEGNPFKLGSFGAGSLQPTLRNIQLFYSPANLFSIFNASTTTLTASVIDADGITILATNSQVITGNLDVSSQNIEIAISNFAADSNKFKANLTVTVNIGAILPNGGHFSVSIIHDDANDGTFTFAQDDIFRDPDNVPAIIFDSPVGTGVTIVENVPVIKRLSGAFFYKEGSTFSLNIPEIDELNNISYPATQVVVDGSAYALPTLNLAGGSLTGWTNAFNNVGASYSLTSWTISTLNVFNLTTTGHVSATPQDWGPQTTVNSTNTGIAVDTFQANETNIFEDFRNENRRIKADLVTVWDSTQSLASYDSGTGLQVYGSQLHYPQVNFTLYNPSSGSQPNYSALTGDRVYYRIFRDLTGGGTSHSNGLIALGNYNITETNLTNDDVRFEISLDGTNWYNLNLDYLGGPLNNGDGCRINSDQHFLPSGAGFDNSLQFTLGAGGFTDVTTGGASGFGIFVRITFRATAAGKAALLGSLNITDW